MHDLESERARYKRESARARVTVPTAGQGRETGAVAQANESQARSESRQGRDRESLHSRRRCAPQRPHGKVCILYVKVQCTRIGCLARRTGVRGALLNHPSEQVNKLTVRLY